VKENGKLLSKSLRPKYAIKKITVKDSQVEGGREGVKEVWTFSQVSPFFLVMASLRLNLECKCCLHGHFLKLCGRTIVDRNLK